MWLLLLVVALWPTHVVSFKGTNYGDPRQLLAPHRLATNIDSTPSTKDTSKVNPIQQFFQGLPRAPWDSNSKTNKEDEAMVIDNPAWTSIDIDIVEGPTLEQSLNASNSSAGVGAFPTGQIEDEDDDQGLLPIDDEYSSEDSAVKSVGFFGRAGNRVKKVGGVLWPWSERNRGKRLEKRQERSVQAKEKYAKEIEDGVFVYTPNVGFVGRVSRLFRRRLLNMFDGGQEVAQWARAATRQDVSPSMDEVYTSARAPSMQSTASATSDVQSISTEVNASRQEEDTEETKRLEKFQKLQKQFDGSSSNSSDRKNNAADGFRDTLLNVRNAVGSVIFREDTLVDAPDESRRRVLSNRAPPMQSLFRNNNNNNLMRRKGGKKSNQSKAKDGNNPNPVRFFKRQISKVDNPFRDRGKESRAKEANSDKSKELVVTNIPAPATNQIFPPPTVEVISVPEQADSKSHETKKKRHAVARAFKGIGRAVTSPFQRKRVQEDKEEKRKGGTNASDGPSGQAGVVVPATDQGGEDGDYVDMIKATVKQNRENARRSREQEGKETEGEERRFTWPWDRFYRGDIPIFETGAGPEPIPALEQVLQQDPLLVLGNKNMRDATASTVEKKKDEKFEFRLPEIRFPRLSNPFAKDKDKDEDKEEIGEESVQSPPTPAPFEAAMPSRASAATVSITEEDRPLEEEERPGVASKWFPISTKVVQIAGTTLNVAKEYLPGVSLITNIVDNVRANKKPEEDVSIEAPTTSTSSVSAADLSTAASVNTMMQQLEAPDSQFDPASLLAEGEIPTNLQGSFFRFPTFPSVPGWSTTESDNDFTYEAERGSGDDGEDLEMEGVDDIGDMNVAAKNTPPVGADTLSAYMPPTSSVWTRIRDLQVYAGWADAPATTPPAGDVTPPSSEPYVSDDVGDAVGMMAEAKSLLLGEELAGSVGNLLDNVEKRTNKEQAPMPFPSSGRGAGLLQTNEILREAQTAAGTNGDGAPEVYDESVFGSQTSTEAPYKDDLVEEDVDIAPQKLSGREEAVADKNRDSRGLDLRSNNIVSIPGMTIKENVTVNMGRDEGLKSIPRYFNQRKPFPSPSRADFDFIADARLATAVSVAMSITSDSDAAVFRRDVGVGALLTALLKSGQYTDQPNLRADAVKGLCRLVRAETSANLGTAAESIVETVGILDALAEMLEGPLGMFRSFRTSAEERERELLNQYESMALLQRLVRSSDRAVEVMSQHQRLVRVVTQLATTQTSTGKTMNKIRSDDILVANDQNIGIPGGPKRNPNLATGQSGANLIVGNATRIFDFKGMKVYEMARITSAALGVTKWRPRRPGQKGLRILSFDGGGTKGVLTISILKELMRMVDDGNPHEMFDMICGTSTGGIIATVLGLRQESVDEMETLYDEFIGKVFGKGSNIKLVSEKAFYDEKELENVLYDICGEELIIDSNQYDCPKVFCVSTQVNTNPPRTQIWRNYNYPQGSTSRYHGTFRVNTVTAVRATTAAPTFFTPVQWENGLYCDGALVANNPCAIALQEAKALYPSVPVELVVSIGTGYNRQTTQSMGMGWDQLTSLIIASTTDTEDVDALLQDFLSPEKYFRFNPILEENIGIDVKEAETLAELKETGKNMVRNMQNSPQGRKRLDTLLSVLRRK